MWTKSEKRIVAAIIYVIYLMVSIRLWMELVSIVVIKNVPEHLIGPVASTIGIALFIIGTVIFVLQLRAIEKRARD